jgi:hypothetical protein
VPAFQGCSAGFRGFKLRRTGASCSIRSPALDKPARDCTGLVRFRCFE